VCNKIKALQPCVILMFNLAWSPTPPASGGRGTREFLGLSSHPTAHHAGWVSSRGSSLPMLSPLLGSGG
jgi:hypothetical protein